ncbi:aminotransferase class IV [Clostridium mediterraneense]|uniref:aminotransferase class IV n=1 Tax=Clostridium mediterraneense TaxID=1805472 RepID=UPI00082CDF72|nr:aminotransferase class IV [Clostridium mediterraneense]
MIKYIKDLENEYISIDSGIQFSKGVFETILIKDNAVFLKEHIIRLNDSLKKIYIDKKINCDQVNALIKNNNIKNCALKIIITEKNSIAISRKLIYTKEDYIKGFKLSISKVRRNSTSMLSYIKSISYVENLIEREKALNIGKNEILFLNEKNFIAECSMSNIFFIKDGVIKTPRISDGILNGIIREWVINNFDVEEGSYTIEEILSADEVFITNSLIGIMSVIEIENINYIKNNITKNIQDKYKEKLEDL